MIALTIVYLVNLFLNEKKKTIKLDINKVNIEVIFTQSTFEKYIDIIDTIINK